MPGPLDGIRILDLTTVFSGPYASLLLGDLGADVVKIESPDGDIARGIGTGLHPGMGPLFVSTNRNKRSVCLDLKQDSASEVLGRLIDASDVVLHNMRPAPARRLGVDPDAVLARNPNAVHCAVLGYGSSGPYADLPAYDDVVQAASGFVSIQTVPGEQPTYVRSVIADKLTGLAAFGAISAALVQRERTGQGLAVEVPMLETLTSFVLIEHLFGATFDPPTGGHRYARTVSPDRRPYRTADGWISVVFYSGAHWQRFFDLIGQPELGRDPRFADHPSRTANIDALYAMVAEAMPARTTAAWTAILGELDVPVMPVNDLEDLADDPHLAAVGMLTDVERPGVGRYAHIKNPFAYSTGIDDDRLPPPSLGQQTVEVLRELGYDDAAIDAMTASGAAVTAQ